MNTDTGDRISLKRKETTELKLGGARGAAAKTVSIEVRKRRTYAKNDILGVNADPVAEAAEAAPELLIIGGTKAGKTHFGGQLLRRLEHKQGSLRLVGAAGDLTPFREVLTRLAQGLTASHTPSGVYKECVWTVTGEGGARSELVWPDYAGEQIESIVRVRHVPEQWVERVRKANGWLFFVRLSLISAPPDILERPRHPDHMLDDANRRQGNTGAAADGAAAASSVEQATAPASAANGTPQAPTIRELSTQEKLVELLQALLYVGQISSNIPVETPALILVLSCYDEAAEPTDGVWEDPALVLRRKLPLLSQFVEANWHPDKLEVIGLSALGKALKEDDADADFVDLGPETQGWCVTKGGVQTLDLTYPVVSIMERLKSP